MEFPGALENEFGLGRGKQMGSHTLKARPEQAWFRDLRLLIEGCAIPGKPPHEPDPAKTGVETCRGHGGSPPDRQSGRERLSWSLQVREARKIEKQLGSTHAVTEFAPKRQIPAHQD